MEKSKGYNHQLFHGVFQELDYYIRDAKKQRGFCEMYYDGLKEGLTCAKKIIIEQIKKESDEEYDYLNVRYNRLKG